MAGEDLLARLKRLELIHAVSRELNNSLDAEALLPRVLKVVLDAVGAEAGSLWLIRGDKLVCEHAQGGAGERIVGMELPRGAGVVGSVAERRKPEIVFDVEADQRHLKQVDDATGFRARSMITVPLLTKGECLGSLQVINKVGEGKRFSPDDASLIQEIAVDAGAAVKNASLLKTERRAREMRALLKMSREITSTLDPGRILTTAANILTGTVHFDRCTVFLERAGTLVLGAVSGKEKFDPADPELASTTALMGWLRTSGEAKYSGSPDSHDEGSEEAKRYAAHAAASGMKSVLVLPLKDDTGSLGLLCMEARKEEFLDEGQLELVETFANQVAVALRNAELYSHTPSIGLFSRRGGAVLGAAPAGLSRRTKILLGAAAALVVAGLVPVPASASGGAEVLPARMHYLRCDAPVLVERIDVEEGERVTKGRSLGSLRREEIEIQIAETESRLRAARAEFAKARAAGAAAESRVAADHQALLETQLGILRERRVLCDLPSPVDGWVLTHRPRLREGSVLPPGTPILELAEADRWRVELKIPQEEIASVVAGAPAVMSSPALPGRRFRGTVVAAAAAGVPTPEGVFFPVTVTVEDATGSLRAGMSGRGKVEIGRRPLAAVALGGAWRRFRWWLGW